MLHNMYILGNMQEEPELKSSAFQCNPHVCEGFLSPKTCMYTWIGTLEKMLCVCVCASPVMDWQETRMYSLLSSS